MDGRVAQHTLTWILPKGTLAKTGCTNRTRSRTSACRIRRRTAASLQTAASCPWSGCPCRAAAARSRCHWRRRPTTCVATLSPRPRRTLDALGAPALAGLTPRLLLALALLALGLVLARQVPDRARALLLLLPPPRARRELRAAAATKAAGLVRRPRCTGATAATWCPPNGWLGRYLLLPIHHLLQRAGD